MYNAGQKLLCVDDKHQYGEGGILLVEGSTYTYRGTNSNGGILLQEAVTNMFRRNGEEVGYKPHRFVPLEESWADNVLEKVFEEELEFA